MNFSCIYRIECIDPNIKDIYIGSTTNLRTRKNAHKTSCNNKKSKLYNLEVYKFIRDHGGWDNWKFDIELLTDGMTKKELVELEQRYIDCLNPTLNNDKIAGNCPKWVWVKDK